MKGGQYHLRFTDKMEREAVGGGRAPGGLPDPGHPGGGAQGQRRHLQPAAQRSDAREGGLGRRTRCSSSSSPRPPSRPRRCCRRWRGAAGSTSIGSSTPSWLLLPGGPLRAHRCRRCPGAESDEEIAIDEIPDRFAKLIVPEKPVTPPKPRKRRRPPPDKPKKEKPKEAKKEKHRSTTAKAAAAAAQRPSSSRPWPSAAC